MTDRGSLARRLPAVLTLALLSEVVVSLASARTLGDGPVVGRWPFATFAGCLLGALGFAWARASRRATRRPAGDVLVAHEAHEAGGLPGAVARWLPLLPAVATGVALAVRGLLLPGPLRAWGIAAAFGAAVMVVTVLLPARWSGARPWLVLVGAVVSGVSLRFFELTVVSLDPSHGDMLPLVLLAGRNALAGDSPYAIYHFPWAVPLTYLPLGWLPYAPLFLTPIDARWTSALAELTVLAAVLFASRRRHQRVVRDAAVVLWASWFVSSRLVSYDGICAASPQWAALAWLAALALERSRWTPVAAGVALATTLLAIPLLPFMAIAWYRARAGSGVAAAGELPRRRSARAALRSLLRFTAIVGFLATVLVVPWFLWSPHEFLAGVVWWFNDLDLFPRAKWTEDRAWSGQPGLTGAFWTFHLERLLKPLQLVALAALAWTYARATRLRWSRASLGLALVAAMLLFLVFNPIIWGYLWEAAVVLGLVTLAAERSGRRASSPLRPAQLQGRPSPASRTSSPPPS